MTWKGSMVSFDGVDDDPEAGVVEYDYYDDDDDDDDEENDDDDEGQEPKTRDQNRRDLRRQTSGDRSPNCDWLRKVSASVGTLLAVIYDHIPFRHLLPIMVLALYTVFGGWLFRHLEYDAKITDPIDIELMSSNRQDYDALNRTVIESDPILSIFLENISEPQSAADVRRQHQQQMMALLSEFVALNSTNATVENRTLDELWDWYDAEILASSANDTTPSPPKPESPWANLWNAMFFSATLYTTIGYGNLAPVTTGGRVAAILYSMIGIPLVLTILNDWGVLLFNFLKATNLKYQRLKNKRKNFEPVAGRGDDIGDLPVSLAVFLLIFWIGASAGIFLIWEDWSYFTSLYFFFISLTTIGLGDVVPTYPQYTLMSFILVLCGLSVVSMSFNIIQTKVENLFKTLMAGIEKEYWQMQVEPGKSQLTDNTGGTVNASIGVMQLWTHKPLKERLLYRMMDRSKKEMLEDLWNKKANTKNQSTQTIVKIYVTEALQVDMDEEEAEKRYRQRKYIYNLVD